MRLITLGELRLDGASLKRPKPLLLLAYLALEGPQPRVVLSELFFFPSQNRADALSTTLGRLKPLGVLFESCKTLGVRLECDALDFLDNPLAHSSYYGGPFLNGLSVPPELEEWLLETRERLALTRRRSLLEEAEAHLLRKDPGAADQLAYAAYQVASAPPPSRGDLERLYYLLEPGSPLRARLKAEALEVGLTLTPKTAPTPHLEYSLPRSLTSFVGRDLERVQILELLTRREARLVTLHGPGGIGKTRLALQIAHDALASSPFVDGVYFVPLDALERPEAVWAQVCTTLEVALTPAASPLDTLLEHLKAQKVLLVLDNFEHLLGAAHSVARLLERCPQVSVLVTSRARLNLQAEWTFPIGGLSVPVGVQDPVDGVDPPDLRDFERSDAVTLFLERAGQARLHFSLTPQNQAAVLALCQLSQGFPLFLELCAAWMKSRGPEQVLRALEGEAGSLETPLMDVRPRHRSMEGALEASWRWLSPEGRIVLQSLSVFSGGFGLETASQVCSLAPGVLEALCDLSLVQHRGGDRYGFHFLVGEFAARKLGQEGVLEQRVRARHSAHFLEWLAGLGEALLGGPALMPTLDALELEWPNLERAWGSLERTPVLNLALPILEEAIWTLTQFGELRARFQEVLGLFERALRWDELLEANPGLRGLLSASCSYLLYRLGRGQQAVEQATLALKRLGDLGQLGQLEKNTPLEHPHWADWVAQVGRAGGNLLLGQLEGVGTGYHAAYEVALEESRQAHTPFERAGAAMRLSISLTGVAVVHLMGGRPQEAKAPLLESLEVLGSSRSPYRCYPLWYLGRMEVQLAALEPPDAAGHFERARGWLEEALGLSQALGYHLLTATLWLEGLRVRLELGELEEVEREAGQVLALARRIGHFESELEALSLQGETLSRLGRHRAALYPLAQTCTRALERGAASLSASALLSAARCLEVMGQDSLALEAWSTILSQPGMPAVSRTIAREQLELRGLEPDSWPTGELQTFHRRLERLLNLERTR